MFSQPTRKRFGQHWLTDEKVLHAMLEAAAVTRQDCVLEIGPGTGALTRWLLPLAKAVVAVEIDRDLCRKLRNQFAKHDNFKLVQSDILELDIATAAYDQAFDFGLPLTVRVQYLADCELVCPVPARAFQPPPQVDSAVVKLTPRPLAIPSDDLVGFDQLVKLGFGSKRKMLRNNLKAVIDRDQLEQMMTDLAIAPMARGEDLSVEQWVALGNTILKHSR
jgi:16S rRNA (adenine1518-N6/adenine1519-N6)-dimethyltransferase